jgi:hypothetical protein
MPTTYSAFIFGSLPLVAGGANQAKSSSAFQAFQTSLYCQPQLTLTGVDHNNLDGEIEYFVPEGEDLPLQGALAYCGGSFRILMDGDHPVVKIKAEHLRWFVFSHIKSFETVDVMLTYILC